jgi:multidrug efflux pump subunit AcrA (membrane-fusion protein)
MKNNLKFLIVIFLAGVLSACGLAAREASTTDTIPVVQSSNAVISEGNLVPRDYAYLAFPTGGHVADILVAAGDVVAEGQILARLGDREQAEANLAAAQLELERAQQDLDTLNEQAAMAGLNAWLHLLNANEQVIRALEAWNTIDTDAYQDRIDNADVRVTQANNDLEDAQADFDTYADLNEDNPTRQRYETALRNAQLAYDRAVAERDRLIIDRERAQANLQLARELQAQAQSVYDATRTGPDPDVLILAQLRVENATAQVAAAQSAIDLHDLKAPFAGTVMDVNVGENDLVSPETWVVLIADTTEWYVETKDLNELEVVSITVGQGATIVPDALPDLSFQGEVTEIADVFGVQSGDIIYQVCLRVSEPDPAFRWGMTVEVTFNPGD